MLADLLQCMLPHSNSCLALSDRHHPHIDNILQPNPGHKHTEGMQKIIHKISNIVEYTSIYNKMYHTEHTVLERNH